MRAAEIIGRQGRNQSKVSIVAVSLAALTALAACSAPNANTGAAQRSATLAKGDLTATVSATGNIQPEADVRVVFQSTGTVAEVMVKVGDRVKKGDVLAKLDTVDLDLALMQAQASLEQTKNALVNSDTAIEQAKNQIIIATSAYSKTVSGVRSADVSAAQAAYDAAVASYDKVVAGPMAEDVAAVEAGMRNADAAVRNAQSMYDAAARFNPAGINGSPQAMALEQATNNLNSARAQYDKAIKGADAAQLAAARQQIENAKANLERTRAPAQSFDIDTARTNIAQSELQLRNAQSQKKNTETQVKLAELAVKQSERRLSQATLVAPMDSTVSQVNIDVGEAAAGATPPFTLVDDSKYHIDITVDEIDIARIQLGQSVDVTLDSLPGVTVKGKVERIAPTSTTINGVVSYQVRVVVEQNGEVQLRSGMTANAAIVIDQRTAVLLAPNWSVRRDRTTGKSFLTIKRGDAATETEVKVGLRNDSFSEIASGANEGDTVVAPTTPNALTQ
jgi:HlyD family secretion protein